MKQPRREREPSRILLDWFTISYRQIYAGLGVVAFLALVALGIWFGYFRQQPLSEQARDEVTRAEKQLGRAAGLVGQKQELLADLNAAREALAVAKDALAARRYERAIPAARSSFERSSRILAASEQRKPVARILEMSGGVEVQPGQTPRWSPASLNQELFVGDKIHCQSSGSATLSYVTGTTQTLYPNMLIQIEEVRINPRDRTWELTLRHDEGQTLIETPDGARVNLRAGKATATTPGRETIFAERPEGPSGPARFISAQGRTEIRAGGRTVPATPNQELEVRGTGDALTITPGKSRISPPALLEPVSDRIFLFDSPANKTIPLRWSTVAGAARYSVQISMSQSFLVLVKEQALDVTSVTIVSPPFGSYWWRVLSLDPEGKPCIGAEKRRFVVKSMADAPSTPPRLEITRKLDFGYQILLEGSTERGATVAYSVNSGTPERVTVNPDGTFNCFVDLAQREEGRILIVVTAQSPFGTEARKTVEHNFQAP